MEKPPDSFNGIGIWSLLGQVVKGRAWMIFQIVLHGPTGVEESIATNDMDVLITAKDVEEVIEVFQESCPVSAFHPSRYQTTGIPAREPTKCCFTLEPGVSTVAC